MKEYDQGQSQPTVPPRGLWCKGCYALKSACDKCERCIKEQNALGHVTGNSGGNIVCFRCNGSGEALQIACTGFTRERLSTATIYAPTVINYPAKLFNCHVLLRFDRFTIIDPNSQARVHGVVEVKYWPKDHGIELASFLQFMKWFETQDVRPEQAVARIRDTLAVALRDPHRVEVEGTFDYPGGKHVCGASHADF